jgi:hypothetical protein
MHVSKLFTSLRGFFLFLLLLLISIDLSAQVVIKERVIIGSGNFAYPDSIQIKKNVVIAESLPPTWYTETYSSGTYLAWLYLSAKYQAPPEDILSVTFRDTTITYCPADYINFRQSGYGWHLDTCDEDEWVSFAAFYASSSRDSVLPFRIPNVHKGDTLIFSYHDCIQPSGSGDVGIAIWNTNQCIAGTCDTCGMVTELSCGISLTPMSFTVRQEEDTLISGSSIALDIFPNGGDELLYYYPKLYDSLMTIEVDSAQYAKFIYDRGTRIDTLDSPMDSVKYCDATTGKITFYAMGKQPEKPVPVTICARFMFDSSRVFEDTIVVKGAEIMLGETKYYYATEAEDKLTIHETTLPELPAGAVTTDIWGNNPVDTVMTDPAKSGRRMGVYWEKEKRIPTDTAHNLPTGMIRLIGRYWHKDSVYTVKLTTKNYPTPASLGIEVKKPSRLGDDYGPLPGGGRRTTVSDVFGNPYNLDSIIINYAGKYGIPPQILKADMQQEGNFQPAYRWEPFVDAYIQDEELQYMDSDFRYKKTTNSEGQPGIPTTHTNVYPIRYPQNDYRTIWNRFFSQSVDLNPGTDTNRYPKRLWKSYPRSRWETKYNTKLNLLRRRNIRLSEAKTTAREYANDWLRDEYRGGVMSEGIAQTRTAASYGLMQLQYATAVEERNYPLDRTGGGQDHLPEYINITDTNLTYAVPFLISRIDSELVAQGDGSGKANNWSYGYERTVIVALNRYNGKKDAPARYSWHYGFDVLEKVYQYIPVK